MKIESELRFAINAAAKTQTELSWQEKADAKREAIEAFLKTRRGLRAKVKRLTADAEEKSKVARAAWHKVDAITEEIGLTRALENFSNAYGEEKFEKAGGVLPPREKRRWKAEEVIAKLAAATTPKQFNAILKEYGIHWG
jgi:hypothetical protein